MTDKTVKPSKPYPGFPLYAHAAGVWAKKIRGKLHYFGPWADPHAAIKKYRAQVGLTTFGAKLKELRTAAGITQEDLADKSGVPLGTIRYYEQGRRELSLAAAQKLVHALGRSLDVFDSVKEA